VGFLVVLWLMIAPTDHAHAENEITSQVSISDTATSTIYVGSTVTIESFTAIIEAAQTAITQAETSTALIETQAEAITSPTETITATITQAQNSIIQAQAVVDSATVAIAQVDSATVLVGEAQQDVNILQLAVESQTAVVESDTLILQNAQTTLNNSETTTIQITEPGLIAKVYSIPSGPSPAIPDESSLIKETIVPYIIYNWGNGQVLNSGVSENVAVEFSGIITLPEDALQVKYAIISDDGARLYINGELVIDQWVDRGGGWGPYSKIFDVQPGSSQEINLWYYENGGGAQVILGYGITTSSGGYFTSPTNNNFSHATTTTSKDPELIQAVNDAQNTLTLAIILLSSIQSNLNASDSELLSAQENLQNAQNNLNILLSEVDSSLVSINNDVMAADVIVSQTLFNEEAERIAIEKERIAAIERAQIAAAIAAQAESDRLANEARIAAEQEA